MPKNSEKKNEPTVDVVEQIIEEGAKKYNDAVDRSVFGVDMAEDGEDHSANFKQTRYIVMTFTMQTRVPMADLPGTQDEKKEIFLNSQRKWIERTAKGLTVNSPELSWTEDDVVENLE